MGLKVVTYEGSDNPSETVFFVGGSRLNRGVPTAIPDEDAKALRELSDAQKSEGHKFDVASKDAPKDAEHGAVVVNGEVRSHVPQPAAAAEATEAAADTDAPAPAAEQS